MLSRFPLIMMIPRSHGTLSTQKEYKKVLAARHLTHIRRHSLNRMLKNTGIKSIHTHLLKGSRHDS